MTRDLHGDQKARRGSSGERGRGRPTCQVAGASGLQVRRGRAQQAVPAGTPEVAPQTSRQGARPPASICPASCRGGSLDRGVVWRVRHNRHQTILISSRCKIPASEGRQEKDLDTCSSRASDQQGQMSLQKNAKNFIIYPADRKSLFRWGRQPGAAGPTGTLGVAGGEWDPHPRPLPVHARGIRRATP